MGGGITDDTRRAVGIALVVGGVTLLFFAMNASESLASELSETFTGSVTDRSVWMLALGAAAGGFMALVPG